MSRKICNNCGREVDDFVKFCPDCGKSSFTDLISEIKPSTPNIEEIDSINPIIATLFYWNENGNYYFSKTKFFSILIFLDIFIARIYYTSNVVAAFIIAAIVTAIAFFIGRAIHNKSTIHTPSAGSLTKDITNMLFYWEESVISKTKILTILIYFIMIIFYCINVGWSMFFAGTLIWLAVAIPVFYVGKYIHNR